MEAANVSGILNRSTEFLWKTAMLQKECQCKLKRFVWVASPQACRRAEQWHKASLKPAYLRWTWKMILKEYFIRNIIFDDGENEWK